MKTMKCIMLLTALLIVVSGCDIFAPYILIIDNQTNDTIGISFSEKSPYNGIREVLPESIGVLYEAEGRATKNGCGYTGINEGEIDIQTSSGRTLKKEIWDVNNWNCNGSFRGGWNLTFVITEDDLE